MKSIFQATLFLLIVAVVFAASHSRQKRQFDQGQISNGRVPQQGSSFGQQNPSFGQQNPSFGQQNPTFGQQNPSFGQQNPSFGQQNPSFGQQNPSFGQQNPSFGQQNPQFGRQNPSFGQTFGGNPNPSSGANQNPSFGEWFVNNQDPSLLNGQFTGFGNFQPNNINQPPVGNGLTFGSNGRTQFVTAQPQPTRRASSGINIPGQGGLVVSGSTTPRPASVRTTPSQQYLSCLRNCPSTNEYNPVCGSDQQNYHNMQRLSCANQCGNQVTFVRRGTCAPA